MFYTQCIKIIFKIVLRNALTAQMVICVQDGALLLIGVEILLHTNIMTAEVVQVFLQFLLYFSYYEV